MRLPKNPIVKDWGDVLLLGAAGFGVWLWLRSRRQAGPVAGELCHPEDRLPAGWSCVQRDIDGAYVLRGPSDGDPCDPLDLPIPGWVCIPAGDEFVLKPEAA